MTTELRDEIFAALRGVSDVLSKVSDAEWAKVQPIQALVNQGEEIANQMAAQYGGTLPCSICGMTPAEHNDEKCRKEYES